MLGHNTLSLLALLLLGAAQRGEAALTQAQITQITDEHNKCRSGVSPTAANMRKMVYNAPLADLAQSYAEKCIYAHNPANGGNGENICATTNANLDVAACVQQWCNEKQDYNLETRACTPPGDGTCGHYTQVVWAPTNLTGCATHVCESLPGFSSTRATIMVCYYSPAGNVGDQKPYVAGTPCSSCSPNTCSSNLCASDATTTTTVAAGGSGAPGIKSGPVTLFTTFLLAGLLLLAF
ncbi:peptidase inhibitor 16 isoform X2 [Ambystoma mexicanum]|uniref:peptidase inhibitor 16 isoform X2 n=1 Tax=Ambystoma mexicanum TaxID=8296 RepID=UPI0037E864EE